MKKLIQTLLTAIFIFSITAEAQNITPKLNRNEAGIEIGGPGIFYNIFYQQYLAHFGEHKSLNLRVGGAVLPLSKYYNGSRIGYNITAMPTMLFFSKRHAWETGLGLSFVDRTSYGEYVNRNGDLIDEVSRLFLLTPQASYRYYFHKNRFYLRGSVLLMVKLKHWDNYSGSDDTFVRPWAGISAGFTL
jgi:hypothetical protein